MLQGLATQQHIVDGSPNALLNNLHMSNDKSTTGLIMKVTVAVLSKGQVVCGQGLYRKKKTIFFLSQLSTLFVLKTCCSVMHWAILMFNFQLIFIIY